MCETLDVSSSGYYAWRQKKNFAVKPDPDAILAAQIKGHHTASHGAYGSPRLQQVLRQEGIRVSRKRVARIMQEHGLRGRTRRRSVKTTVSDPMAKVAPNVLDRPFSASAANTKWVTDITYLPTAEGWLYLAVVVDLYSRRIVGHATADNLRTELALQALDNAVGRRKPEPGLLHHSDQGCQYTSFRYQQQLASYGMVCSMSRRGQCWDNCVVESFFGRLKEELLPMAAWESRQQAAAHVVAYIEGFYNVKRVQKRLGYLSPIAYEAKLLQHFESA